MKITTEIHISHRSFFNKLANQFKIEHPEQWYSISVKLLYQDKIAKSILWTYYRGDLTIALRSIFPEYNWKLWKFKKVKSLLQNSEIERKYLSNLTVQKEYLEWFKEEHGIKKLQDMYNLKATDFVKKGGSTLINHYYRGSVFRIISTLYKESNGSLFAWKYQRIPKYFWEETSNVVRFLEYIQDYYLLSKGNDNEDISDWKKLSSLDFSRLGGYSLVIKYGGILSILQTFKPHLFESNNDWKYDILVKDSKSQKVLNSHLKNIFSS